MFATVISLSSCATRQPEVLTPWLNSVQTNPVRSCIAHFKLQAETEHESVLADTILSFDLNGKKSSAELKILNSLYMTVAKLNLSSKQIRWVDQDGEKNIAVHPLFKSWFQPNWWQEIAFIFGLPLRETQNAISQNQEGRPVLFQKFSRKIKCGYESGAAFPATCSIDDRDFSARLNFTSAECRSPI